MVDIDPHRLAEELAADADVVHSLRENGDVPHIPRPVDVRFVGAFLNIQRLAKNLDQSDWHVLGMADLGGGVMALDIQRIQTTEPETLKALTVAALGLELRHGVRYDGWGTVATKGGT